MLGYEKYVYLEKGGYCVKFKEFKYRGKYGYRCS